MTKVNPPSPPKVSTTNIAHPVASESKQEIPQKREDSFSEPAKSGVQTVLPAQLHLAQPQSGAASAAEKANLPQTPEGVSLNFGGRNVGELLSLIKNRVVDPRITGTVNATEIGMLESLVKLRHSLPSDFQPRKQLIYTDVRKDPDDQNALLLMMMLHKFGLVQIAGIVASTDPTTDRARFVKALCEEHGLSNIPVAAGDAQKISDDRPGQFDCIAGHDFKLSSQSGADFAAGLLNECKDKETMDIICLSPLGDIAQLLNAHKDAHKHIGKITFQSSMGTDFTVPPKGKNHNLDANQEASQKVFDYLSAHRAEVNALFVPSSVPGTAKVDGMKYYEALKQIGTVFRTPHNTTEELHNQQEAALVELFADVAEGKRPFAWQPFAERVFGIKDSAPTSNKTKEAEKRADLEAQAKELVKKVQTFVLYDPSACVLSVDVVSEGLGLTARSPNPQEAGKAAQRELGPMDVNGDLLRLAMTALIKGTVVVGQG